MYHTKIEFQNGHFLEFDSPERLDMEKFASAKYTILKGGGEDDRFFINRDEVMCIIETKK